MVSHIFLERSDLTQGGLGGGDPQYSGRVREGPWVQQPPGVVKFILMHPWVTRARTLLFTRARARHGHGPGTGPRHGPHMDQKSTVFGVPWHGSKIDRLRGSLAWITSHQITSNQITSHQITSHQIRSDQITSHHITSHHTTSQHGPGAKRQKNVRNG